MSILSAIWQISLVQQSSNFRFGHSCSVTDCLDFVFVYGVKGKAVFICGHQNIGVFLLFLLLLRLVQTADALIPGAGPRASGGECLCLAKRFSCASLSSLCGTRAPCLCTAASFTLDGICSFSQAAFVCVFFRAVSINALSAIKSLMPSMTLHSE